MQSNTILKLYTLKNYCDYSLVFTYLETKLTTDYYRKINKYNSSVFNEANAMTSWAPTLQNGWRSGIWYVSYTDTCLICISLVSKIKFSFLKEQLSDTFQIHRGYTRDMRWKVDTRGIHDVCIISCIYVID